MDCFCAKRKTGKSTITMSFCLAPPSLPPHFLFTPPSTRLPLGRAQVSKQAGASLGATQAGDPRLGRHLHEGFPQAINPVTLGSRGSCWETGLQGGRVLFRPLQVQRRAGLGKDLGGWSPPTGANRRAASRWGFVQGTPGINFGIYPRGGRTGK